VGGGQTHLNSCFPFRQSNVDKPSQEFGMNWSLL
jgi:hypothetical protein